MTKKDLIDTLTEYPDDIVIAGFRENPSSEESEFYIIREVVRYEGLEWIDDVIKGVESKPYCLVLKGR